MDTAANEQEKIAITEMLNKGVHEDLIRAFSWSWRNMISHRLIQVSEAHAKGQIGEFDMFDNMKHAQKAVAALAQYGYKATIKNKGELHGFEFMTEISYTKQDGSLLIEPR